MSARAVARALAYPFNPQEGAFTFEDGRARAFDFARGAALVEGRTPVLAAGSNASPVRLLEKFGREARLAVTCARAPGHIVAHSARYSAYGAIPATLHPWEGAEARLHVTWLTADQLAVMDASESLGTSYDRIGVRAHFVEFRETGRAEAYVSRAGALSLDGRPAATKAARLTEPAAAPAALCQRGAQAHAAALLGLGARDLHVVVAENATDDALRARRSAQLSRLAGLPYGPARA